LGFALTWRVLLLLAPILPNWTPPFFAGSLYPGDHDDFVRWGIQATDVGLFTLYTQPPPRHLLQTWNAVQGRWVHSEREFDRICNYPPLSAYLFFASGALFKAVSAERIINTPVSLALFAGWSVLGEFFLAAGCAAIAAAYASRRTAFWVAVAVLFAPPFWWDSLVWAQMDCVLLATAVWMVYAMLRDRWLWAGILWGVMLGLKPQAVLFAPVWGFAQFSVRPWYRPTAGGCAAAALLAMLALPFQLTSGWAWFQLSYWKNFFGTYTEYVSMKAFNLWNLDVLLTANNDATIPLLGISRGAWGKLLLLGGLLTLFVWLFFRWGRDRRGLILWIPASLLCFVMLPTAVHERYLILALPFVGLTALITRRIWPGLILLSITAMAQLSWPMWSRTSVGAWPQVQKQIVSRWEEWQSAGREQPPLSTVLSVQKAIWQENHDRTLPLEWIFTLSGLLGAGFAVTAIVMAKPVVPGSVPVPLRTEEFSRLEQANRGAQSSGAQTG
jgi:hypothetical protein